MREKACRFSPLESTYNARRQASVEWRLFPEQNSRIHSFIIARGVAKMYCPRCATQNADNAKFCRACGTDLEAVALVLTNKFPLPGAWLEKYGEGKHKVITGALLLGAALLIGAVPALFIGVSFPLVMLWTVFFGWMAGWGIVSLASGVGEMVTSKTMLRQMKQFGSRLTPTEPSELSSAARGPRMLDDVTRAKPYSPLSVTEHTTELLDDQPPRG